jgi:hypothetical protein
MGLILFLRFPTMFSTLLVISVAVALAIIAGTAIAPAHRLTAAGGFWILATLFVWKYLRSLPSLIAAFIGGVVATAVIGIWVHPRRPAAARRWILTCSGILVVGLLVFFETRRLDWPRRQDPLPWALGTNVAGVTACYTHDLGGFMDTQQLWCLDVTPEAVQLISARLRLETVSVVPPPFWNHSPHWWPRRLPAGAVAFQSSEFEAYTRGRDGDHYFMLYDKEHQRVFVWAKFNF